MRLNLAGPTPLQKLICARPDVAFANNDDNTLSVCQNVVPFGGPPVITSQPTNQMVATGNTAAFTVTAAGSIPLIYQWSFNRTNIDGATNTSLTLTNVQLDQSGNCAVQLTNTLGSAISSNAVLAVVLMLPGVVTPPSSLTNAAGTMATFILTASGSMPLSYQWQKNGPGMTDGGNVSGSTATNLTLSNVQDIDAADYTVVITNVAGSITSSVASLTVIDPPAITAQPTNQTVAAGRTAFLSATASGTTPLNYQWLKNGSGMTDGGNVSGSATATLMLTTVSLSDMAGYSVVVTNFAGSVTSLVATLTVAAPPSITAQPANRTNTVGAAASFAVTASGTPPLSCQWNFNGTNIVNATNTTLTLGNVQLSQAGNYSVLVTNNYGSILSSNALLTVNPAPNNVPVITAFSPISGTTGTLVTITGLNFSPAPGNDTVYFGSVKAVVSAASATNLVVSVPAGATDAPITETVNGLTAYSSTPFLPTFLGAGILANSSFGTRVDLGLTNGPAQVVIADLDGVGKPDLVIISGANSAIVSIYRNISANGSLTTGSFAPRVDLPAGYFVLSLV